VVVGMSTRSRVAAAAFVVWLAVTGLAACGGGAAVITNGDPNGGGTTTPPPPAPTYTVGGTVSGAASTGLVLLMNGASLTVPAGVNNFVFSTQLYAGATYAVSISTQPSGELCSVANGTGKVGSANVSNVVITCSNQGFSLGGTISGLTTTGLVLGNGTDQLTIGSTDTSFTFHTLVATSSSYAVKVVTQPNGQACAVTNGNGTMGSSNVTNVTVSCTSDPFTLGGTVNGLTTSGLVLLNSATHENLTIPAAGSFTFAQKVAFGTQYAVTIATQPTGQTCTVSSGSGTMPASNQSNVIVTCSNPPYALGGTLSGYSGSVSLSDGTDTINATAGSFTFPTPVAFNAPYTVSVVTQPTGYSCSVSGTYPARMPAHDVNNVTVTCATNSYTLSGQISGLTVGGLVLANGADHTPVSANATQFSMMDGVAFGASYNVTVLQQPGNGTSNLKCVVTNGSGTMPAANTNTVRIDCTPMLWTWEGGANTTNARATQLTAFGQQGTPGARDSFMTWTDSAGHFWMFGGQAVDWYGTVGTTNEVWTLDPTASTPAWTWKAGANLVNATPVWGTKGIAAAGNTPGGRNGAATWVDSAGRLWLFGGTFFDGSNPAVAYSDLWFYDTNTNWWTWVAGPQATNDSAGTYGTIHTPAAGNNPPARSNAVSWVDGAGHLWLFSGAYTVSGTHGYNDVWMFDPSSGQWTWQAGNVGLDNGANYGALNTQASTNTPGARAAAMVWVDKAGLVWMFGGYGFDVNGSPGYLNDLWNYNTSSNAWVWVGGPNTRFGMGTYSGTPPTVNWPGSRAYGFAVSDSDGKFYLFGGQGFGASAGPGDLNDFWSFDTTTGLWTAINASSGVDQPGVYGTQGVGDVNNLPGARSALNGWVDSAGHVWLLGGSAPGGTGDLNDLWKY
jgi:hypothetical protein